MAASSSAALAWTTAFTWGAITGAATPVMGSAYAARRAQFTEKTGSVFLCRLDTAILAASAEYLRCTVDMKAALRGHTHTG